MKLLKTILLLVLSSASITQAYDGSKQRGFYVCENFENDYLVVDARQGKVTFHNPKIYKTLTVTGSDVLTDYNSPEESFTYYVFNETNNILKINEDRNGALTGRIEASFQNSKVLKTFHSCVWEEKSNF
ncbi:hypothetical protein D3C87_1374040 [compost metagenome]